MTFAMPVENSEFQLFVFGDVAVEAMIAPSEVKESIPLSDTWACELLPTMDNTWGDFELPATAGLLPVQIKEINWHDEPCAWAMARISLRRRPS